MYAEDTFFQLSIPARTGLTILSAVLALLTVSLGSLAYRRLMRLPKRLRLIARLAAALALLWSFVWLTPQLYYTYYQAVIPRLPVQIVIQSPPGPARLAEILTLTGPRTLSEHSKALLGWMLIALALYPTRRRS